MRATVIATLSTTFVSQWIQLKQKSNCTDAFWDRSHDSHEPLKSLELHAVTSVMFSTLNSCFVRCEERVVKSGTSLLWFMLVVLPLASFIAVTRQQAIILLNRPYYPQVLEMNEVVFV